MSNTPTFPPEGTPPVPPYWRNEDDWITLLEYLRDDDPKDRSRGAEAIGHMLAYARMTDTRMLALIGSAKDGAFLQSTSSPVKVNQAFGEGVVLGQVRMRHLPETIRCYIDVTASSKSVIGLFSGKQERELGSAVRGSELHVFNWDGQLIEIDQLDSSVSRIQISPEGDVLRAIRLGADPAILEYRLAELPH